MTIRQIAKKAGVSPAAVSLVVNHKKGVSEETRRRVQSIVDECGYVSSAQKKQTERCRLMVIKYRAHGIALEENQGFIASIIDHIEAECRRHEYDLMMCGCEAENAASVIAGLMVNPPDGVILIATELRRQDYAILDLFTVPVVVLDNHMPGMRVDSVVMDNESLMAEQVRYLYSLGYRQIDYLKFSLAVNNCDERYRGYLAELERLGLERGQVLELNPTVNGSYADMEALIRSGRYVPHGAIVADNDTVAIGAMKAIREAGYSVPEDVSIVGFDDIPFSAVTVPPLTTMRISRKAMGYLAIDTLRKRFRHPDLPCMHIQIDGERVVRSSTRPKKKP